MGYYLLPEHYLLAWHPHEHDPICCELHEVYEGDLLTSTPKYCQEKENHKQVYSSEFGFFYSLFLPQFHLFIEITPLQVILKVINTSPSRAPPFLLRDPEWHLC